MRDGAALSGTVRSCESASKAPPLDTISVQFQAPGQTKQQVTALPTCQRSTCDKSQEQLLGSQHVSRRYSGASGNWWAKKTKKTLDYVAEEGIMGRSAGSPVYLGDSEVDPGGLHMVSEQHVELPGSRRPAVANAKGVGEVDPDQPVTLTLALRGPRLPDADHIPPVGLTTAEFAKRYGADPADVKQVEQVMTGYGFTVGDVSLAARTLQIHGTVGHMQEAFRPQLAFSPATSARSGRGKAPCPSRVPSRTS
jgi:hypothetical protein